MLDQPDKGLTVWPVNFSQHFSLTAPFLCNKRRTVPAELSDFKNHNRLMSAAGGTMFRVDGGMFTSELKHDSRFNEQSSK
jgi:hypothetical protein